MILFSILAIAFIFFALLMLLMQKNRIILDISPNNRIELHIPTISIFGIWADYNCTLYRISEDNKIEVSKLLLNTFARPLLLLLSESKDKLFILYDFDVSVELLVFDIDSIRTKEIPKELDNIVEVSKWNVRRATETEVNYLKNYIINAGIMDLRNLSNSTLDFGFYRYYLTKNQLLNVINRIRLGLKEQEG